MGSIIEQVWVKLSHENVVITVVTRLMLCDVIYIPSSLNLSFVMFKSICKRFFLS
jgi:hypothetical protein